MRIILFLSLFGSAAFGAPTSTGQQTGCGPYLSSLSASDSKILEMYDQVLKDLNYTPQNCVSGTHIYYDHRNQRRVVNCDSLGFVRRFYWGETRSHLSMDLVGHAYRNALIVPELYKAVETLIRISDPN